MLGIEILGDQYFSDFSYTEMARAETETREKTATRS
jgi:hypothetical protein